MQKSAHYIALDDFGGLQTLFMSWASACHDREREAPFAINRAKAPPLPQFELEFRRLGSSIHRSAQEMSHAKKIWALLQGRSLGWGEPSLRKLLISQDVQNLVCWNALPPDPIANVEVTVYDHGLSWIQRPTAAKRGKLARARKFIAISRASRAMLKQRWGVEQSIDILPNPLRWTSEPRSRSLQPSFSSRPIILGCAGRLLSFKGFASVFHAVSILRRRGCDLVLEIAGTGEEEGRLRELASRLQIGNSVTFLGHVSDMQTFYDRIDIFVCPSLREPFGLVSLEALSHAVPTILSHVDGLGETLPCAGAAVLIEPTVSLNDYVELGGSLHRMPQEVYDPIDDKLRAPLALAPEELADAVEMIVQSFSEYQERANGAAMAVASEFSLDTYTMKLINLIS